MDHCVGEFVRHVLQPGDELLSGCAEGVDTAAFEYAMDVHGSKVKRIAVPPVGAFHNRSLVDIAHEIIDVPPYPDHRRRATDAYRRRNEVLVENCEQLAGFVWEEVFYRSGEWMSINIAREVGKPVTFFQADRNPR
jgi:predicted Rossmann fold nucleotide-binding protein DprA/Smf involved in DNA uptake